MSVDTNTVEFALATKEVLRLEQRGFGYYDVCTLVMAKVMSQGFSQEYSQQVAEAAWDHVCA